MEKKFARAFSRTEPFTVRFTAGEVATLRRLADELGLNLSELIRFLLSRGLEVFLSEVEVNGDTASR